jgi:hypothetical protein
MIRKNYDRYMELTSSINAMFGSGFTDECEDAENCGYKNDDSEEFWKHMVTALNISAGMRLSEAGLDYTKAGVMY